MEDYFNWLVNFRVLGEPLTMHHRAGAPATTSVASKYNWTFEKQEGEQG